MKSYARQELILERVSSGQTVTLDELIDATGASPSTVRRDVRALEEAGRVVSLRGGAIRTDDKTVELPAAAKSLIHREEKLAISRAAAQLVQDNETIYLDSGTTALEMVRNLHGQRVHIITSNTQVLALPIPESITVTALGGDFLPDIGSVAGTMTDRDLSDLFFDRAFIGVTGVSAHAGITTFDIREANKKRIVQSHSRRTYVLADSSKFGKSSLCRAFGLGDCTVITDQNHELLREAGDSIVATPDAELRALTKDE